MVDKANREIAARVLRDLVDGKITNEQFMKNFPMSADSALPAIRYFAWGQFSDWRIHRLIGKDAPPPEQKTVLEICCMFLKTNLEFEWPLPILTIPQTLLRIVTFGRWGRRLDNEYKSQGDYEVWPFLRKDDYETFVLNRRQDGASNAQLAQTRHIRK